MPPLTDSNFDRTIVYLVEHSADGALGVVLNRPTSEVTAQIDRWMRRSSFPSVVFGGGPVEPNALIALARRPPTTGGTAGFSALPAPAPPGIGTVDLTADPDDVLLDDLRMYRGYSGWGPGQLEGELRAEAWAIVAAVADDLFQPEPSRLWRRVLARQAPPLAWIARLPGDISAN